MLQFLLVDINCEDASLSVYDVDQQVYVSMPFSCSQWYQGGSVSNFEKNLNLNIFNHTDLHLCYTFFCEYSTYVVSNFEKNKEMKKFNYKLEIGIFRNSTQKYLGVLRGSF